MAIQPGTQNWPFDIIGAGPSSFRSPFVDGQQLDAASSWTVTNPPRGIVRETLAGNGVIQASLANVLATLNTKPELTDFTVNVQFDSDWRTLKESLASVRFSALWPATDQWGLTGAAGQRQTFFIARNLPWIDLPFATFGDQMEANFKPNGAAAVPLAIITTGTPTDSEILVPAAISGFPSFATEADYTVQTGDLTAHGPGRLLFMYHPTRFGSLTVGDAVNAQNSLTFSVSFQEALPLRRWENSV